MKHFRYSTLVLVVSALSAGMSMSAQAEEKQDKQQAKSQVLEEVIVNARRREENLQDVAISMTVFSQKDIDDANITNAGDLGMYTPSLQTVDRFGGDNTTFAIRGFSQELRTTASVGVYFAEVVAPRGANTQQSGDGAGPGNFFDLANVQVLKGPTGTLFGRNTTGGAVLLMPKKPTDEFEGYVEASMGNYDMWQAQGVVNIPVSNNFKLRLGVDRKQRDGYLNNISGVGPDDFADVDYIAYRVSALWDITDAVENYTIFRYSNSDNNGYPRSLLYCNPGAGFGPFCQADLDARRAAGKDRFYDTYNFVSKPINEQKLSQIINTTTWEVNDNLTFKNILSFATFESRQRTSIYGTNWELPVPVAPGVVLTGPILFQMVGVPDGEKTTDQETWVEEFQVQGTAFDKRLTWQAGLYFERSKPGSDYGERSGALISCDIDSLNAKNPFDMRCNNLIGLGAVQNAFGGVEYTNKAVFAQGTYDLTDMVSLTAGWRYTDDDTEGEVLETVYYFPSLSGDGLLPGQYAAPNAYVTEKRKPKTSSEEPTWLLEVDVKPLDNTLVYAKYIRGYRQGSVNLAGAVGVDTHEPETVDTYEIGWKQVWEGRVPTTLNMDVFYNEFDNQQIQYGYFKSNNVGTTAIINAGSSVISGFELEGKVQPVEQLIFSVGYSYLDSEVKDLEDPTFPPGSVSVVALPSTTTAEGEPLSYVPRHNYVVKATWLIPANPEIGDMSFSSTYVFTDEMQAASKASSAHYKLEDYKLLNFNFNWERMFGSSVDFSAFVTNYNDEEYVTFLSGNWNNGMEFGQVGQPKMYGARLRYNF